MAAPLAIAASMVLFGNYIQNNETDNKTSKNINNTISTNIQNKQNIPEEQGPKQKENIGGSKTDENPVINQPTNFEVFSNYETLDNSEEDKLENNQLQPFIKSKNRNLDNFDRKLKLFTGDKNLNLKKPKKEAPALFKPKKQNIHGGQNYSNQYQQHLNAGRYYTNELPFEQKKITPGLGFDNNFDSMHGFHQDIRQYELPKNIDELRSKSNPKISYKGKIIQGKSKINNRDSDYNFTKYKKAAMFFNRPLEKSAGYIKEKGARPKVILQATSRANNVGQLMGPEIKGRNKGEYRSKINKSKKNTFANDYTRNVKTKNAKFDTNRDSYNCQQTKREEQAVLPFEKKHYIANLLKALIPVRHYEDKARQTVKETTSHIEDKNIVNLNTNNQKTTLHYTDKARQTVKETTSNIQDKNIINLKGGAKNIQRYADKAKQTIKETTVHNIKDVINIKLYNKLPKRTKQIIAKTLKECLLHTPRLGNATLINNSDKPKESYVIDIPKLETTLKETLVKDSQLLNLMGNIKHKVYLKDKARITHKQTYSDKSTIGPATQNISDGYKIANFNMIDTNRQSTSDKDYYGISNREDSTGYLTNKHEAKETNKESYVDNDYYGTSQGDLQPMSYQDIYNATMNEVKETIAVGRQPTLQGPKESVSGDDINIQINKNMCVNTRTPLIKTIVSNSVLPLKTENGEDLFLQTESNKYDVMNDSIKANAERDTDAIVKQIEANPLNISIV